MEIELRRYQRADAGPLLEAAHESSAEVYPWLPWCHLDLQMSEVADWLEDQVRAWDEKTAFEFAIWARDGRFLGGCGVNLLNSFHQVANLGYWVRTSAVGRGVASQAVRKAAAWAFENTDLQRLEILCSTRNHASQRVAEKAGALREGVARSRLRIHEQQHDAVVYSLVRDAHQST
jgi:ribosomal-protein-serine acetyltransferase